MSTVTLLDEIADLKRRLAGAQDPISPPRPPGEWLRTAGDDEDEDDLFGEDDLGFDDIDEDEVDEDEDLEEIDGDLDEEL
jgi:hypothetical protein